VRPAAPPRPRLAHSRCPQSGASPPQATQVCFAPLGRRGSRQSEMTPTPTMLRQQKIDPFSFVTPGFQRLPPIFHSVAAAINGNHLRMMKQPVEQRAGQNLVSEQAAPLGKTRIGGQQDGAMLIASGDQLKEMVRL